MAMFLALVATLAAPSPESPIVPGTVAVRREAPPPRGPSPRAAFDEAVEDALVDTGFTVIPSADNARYAVVLTVRQAGKGAVLARGAGKADVATAGGPGPGGAGMAIALPNRNSTVGETVSTALSLTITRRGESAPAWQGRAVTQQVAGTRGGDPRAIATKLATALVRNLQQPSGLTISVP